MTQRAGFLSKLWSILKTMWGENPELSYKGSDVYGNRFYESELRNPQGKNTRMGFPPNESKILNRVSPEWEAWLRYRRNDPPTQEEVARNLNIAMFRREKANERVRNLIKENPEFAAKFGENERSRKNKLNPYSSYPTYKEYSSDACPPDKEKK